MKYPLYLNLWRSAKQLKRNVILMAKTYKPGFVLFFLEGMYFAPDPVCILLTLAFFGSWWALRSQTDLIPNSGLQLFIS